MYITFSHFLSDYTFLKDVANCSGKKSDDMAIHGANVPESEMWMDGNVQAL